MITLHWLPYYDHSINTAEVIAEFTKKCKDIGLYLDWRITGPMPADNQDDLVWIAFNEENNHSCEYRIPLGEYSSTEAAKKAVRDLVEVVFADDVTFKMTDGIKLSREEWQKKLDNSKKGSRLEGRVADIAKEIQRLEDQAYSDEKNKIKL